MLIAVLSAFTIVPSAQAAPSKPASADPLLHQWFNDTWRSFDAMTGPSGLPTDNYCRSGSTWQAAGYTSPTNIGAYLWTTLAADKLGTISHGEAIKRLRATLATLAKLDTAHGFYFNWYDPATGRRLTTWPADGSPVRPFLSTVDNAWLAVGLTMVRNTHPELRKQAAKLLAPMDFGFFYDAFQPADPYAHPGQMYGGYWTDDNTYTGFHYGTLNTEPRMASYLGIAAGDVPGDHYYRMFRTLPANYDWQEQIPEGTTATYDGVSVFEGHYTYRGKRIVPTWGGSMFEALMVPLFVPEAQWAPNSWGVTHPLYVKSQIEHGLLDAKYGYWGFSPSNKPEGGYKAYGVDAIGMEPNGYPSNNDDTFVDRFSPPPPPSAYTNGVVTPHASLLALPYAGQAAMDNLTKLIAHYPVYGPYGFYDSVNVDSGAVSSCVLALDQGMAAAAMANALTGGWMQTAFVDRQFEGTVRSLIAPEHFTAGS
ncbi:MAG: glucoamylase family protein [Mycobacteriales bacterium]